MRLYIVCLTILSILCLILAIAYDTASAHGSNPPVTLAGSISEDTYLAGNKVKVDAEVDGDLLIAAGDANIAGVINGDLLAAARELNINGELNDDVRAAGGKVSLCAQVTGDASIAGGDVTICKSALLSSNTWLAGSDIRADGKFAKKLLIKGGDVVLAGEFADGVRIEALSVEVLASANIIGDLEYTSPTPAKIHESAKISGEENYTISDPWWGSPNGKLDAGEIFIGATVAFILIVFSLALTTLILSGALPNTYARTPTIIRTEFLKCLIVGLTFVVTVPVVLALLAVTIVGIPLAVIFFFAYILMFFVGFFASVMLLADSLYKRMWTSTSKAKLGHILSIIFATLIVIAISQIPLIGGVFLTVLTFTGIGAVCLFISHSRKLNTGVSGE